MHQQLTDRLRFLRAFAAHPRQVGAILPTSRLAVRDMLDMGDVPGARLVVELGAGTGSQTGEILARLAPDARLIALEIDKGLADLLRERYDDPRLQVVADSAENLDEHLGDERADVVVCALPFTSLEPGLPPPHPGVDAAGARPWRSRAGHPVLAADPIGAATAVRVRAAADLAAERAARVPLRLLERARGRRTAGLSSGQRRAVRAAISCADSRVGAAASAAARARSSRRCARTERRRARVVRRWVMTVPL
jgi:hypothetical protein